MSSGFLKSLIFVCFFYPDFSFAQDYLDIFKIGYFNSFNNSFEGSSSSTNVSVLEADLTFPIILNSNSAIVTGFIFSKNRLQLYPPDNGVESPYSRLFSTTFKLGFSSTLNEKWSLTFILLPKIQSDYHAISQNDIFIGGIGILKMNKRKNLSYRLGLYSSSEAFGFYTTPIIGWYSLSKNKKFEMDMFLPISADINYTVKNLTYGFSYFGIGRSFNLEKDNSNQYVQLNSLEFAGYVQLNRIFKNVLLRAKIGFSSDDYQVHEYGNKIGFGFIAFNFKDDRIQLNPKINGSPFLKLELVYRIFPNK